MSDTTGSWDAVLLYPCTRTAVGLTVLAGYLLIAQCLRFRRVQGFKTVDIEKDPSSVYRKMIHLEFPFMGNKALEFALFRTYGVPSISRILQKTKQFKKCAGKRYDDTDILLREYSENKPGSHRAKSAIARLNAIHQLYAKDIRNTDMLYTLALFITEPITWIDRFEWRRTTRIEKECVFAHYKAMGDCMGIRGVDDWKTWNDAFSYQTAYEAKHSTYAESNEEVSASTLDLFLTNIPRGLQFLRPIGRLAICALIDKPLLTALGLPECPCVLKWFVQSSLLIRAMAIRFLFLPRPAFLEPRRTPYSADNDGLSCPVASCLDGFVAASDPISGGAENILRKPRFHQFTETKLGCLSYTKGYRIKDVGTKACPAGRLMHDRPTYEGPGGGLSGT